MAEAKKLFPGRRLVIAAALAGALAGGAFALYVSGRTPGNPQTQIAGSDDACAIRADAAKALAEAATGEVAAMLPADPPQSLAALAFRAPDDTPMTIGSLAGKTLLVNLWATWCAPCRAEMPALDTLQAERGGEAFEVVAVNVDAGTFDKPAAFLEEIGVQKLARYRDNTLGLFNELKTRGLALGLPVTLLVDKDGCLLAHMNGPAAWESSDALRLVDAAVRG